MLILSNLIRSDNGSKTTILRLLTLMQQSIINIAIIWPVTLSAADRSKTQTNKRELTKLQVGVEDNFKLQSFRFRQWLSSSRQSRTCKLHGSRFSCFTVCGSSLDFIIELLVLLCSMVLIKQCSNP